MFDVAGIEAESAEDWWWLLGITGVVGTLGLLGFGLGVLVMRKAVAPVGELAKVVASIDLQHLSVGDHKRILARRFGEDEVGMLAATIEQTLERISAFIVRERYFTGSASHELRTPITVIKGALELLEQGELSPAGQGPITIKLNAQHLLITNQVGDEQLANAQPFEAAPHGYGLGLGIVQRLCERNGWTFELNVEESHVAARLCW